MRLKKINCEGTFQWLDLVLLAQIAAIAIPSIMQQSVLSIGNMFVQEIVNRYGSAVIAGYSGAIKLNTFAINSFMALGSCLSSYTAQNLGAGKKERLPLGFRTGIRLSVIASLPFIVLYFFASRQMMGLFLNDSSIDAINANSEKTAANTVISDFTESGIQVINGRYGPYIAYKGNNYRLPKTLAERAKELTLEECMTVVKEQDEKPKTTARKRTYSKKK